MKEFVSGFACGVIFTSAVFTWRVRAEFRKELQSMRKNHGVVMKRIYNDHDEELKRMREEALILHKKELKRMREEECAELRNEIEAGVVKGRNP